MKIQWENDRPDATDIIRPGWIVAVDTIGTRPTFDCEVIAITSSGFAYRPAPDGVPTTDKRARYFIGWDDIGTLTIY